MKKLLFLSSVVVLIAGWGATPPPTPINAETPLVISQVSPDSTDTAADVQPKVELLTAGAQPRRQLRFTPAATMQQTTVLTMNMDMRGTVNGQVMPTMDLPAIKMTVDTNVTKIDANGDSHVNVSYSDVNLASDTTAPPELIESLRSQLQKMTGARISYVIDNQGKTKDVNVVLPEDLDPNLKQLMNQMLSSLEQLSASPFPEEPVGVGAQWLISSSAPIAGLPLDEIRVLYELVEFQDNAVVLKMSMEQQADPQASSDFNLPGLPPDVDMNLRSFALQSTGTMTVGLDRIMPLSGAMSTISSMEFAVREPDSEQETIVNMVSSVEMTMESK